MYPSNVWKKEKALEHICQARMEAIQHLELQYNNVTYTYSDSISKIRNEVLTVPKLVSVLDSVISWEDVIKLKQLKRLIKKGKFPEKLRTYILKRIKSEKPLENLMGWDSLGYKLVVELDKMIENSDSSNFTTVDSSIVWSNLIDRYTMFNIMEEIEMPHRVRRKGISMIKKDNDIIETPGWEYIRNVFYDTLNSIISCIKRRDIWVKGKTELWEDMKRYQWETAMDTMNIEEQDSIWSMYNRRFWEREKDLVWKEEKGNLWEKEKEMWGIENEALWNRIVAEKWVSERKQIWEKEKKKDISNSELEWFNSNRDSLWRQTQLDQKEEWIKEHRTGLLDSSLALFEIQKDSLWQISNEKKQAEIYEDWKKDNKKLVRKVIKDLWMGDRRMTWEDEGYNKWLEQKNVDRINLWKEIKEEIWKTEKLNLWEKEKIKISNAKSALRKLDQSIKWNKVFQFDHIKTIVNNLQLPNSRKLWKMINNIKKEKESRLNQLGVVGLFRKTLLDSLIRCPVAHVPYIIDVDDSTAIKQVGIYCPIDDTDRRKFAIKVRTTTKDTIFLRMRTPLFTKIFGGGSLKSHGIIEKSGERSWEKRGR
jgi:hypothetical protein